MFGTVVVLVCGLAISSATIYETILRSGVSIYTPDEELEAEIPDGQCTGRLTLKEFACIFDHVFEFPPDVLEVKVGDNSGVTKIDITSNLDLVDVIRSGDCKGSVTIYLKKHCSYHAKRAKRDARAAEFKPLRAEPILARAY